MLGASLNPPNWATQSHGQPCDHRVLGIDMEFRSKATADCRDDHPDLRLFNSQNLGKGGALDERLLR